MIDEVHGLRPDLLKTEKALLGIAQSNKKHIKKGAGLARISEIVWNTIIHSKQESFSLTELVEATGLSKEKVSQKLYKLKSQGFLKLNEDGTWSVGLK